jgi:hypothetical protein
LTFSGKCGARVDEKKISPERNFLNILKSYFGLLQLFLTKKKRQHFSIKLASPQKIAHEVVAWTFLKENFRNFKTWLLDGLSRMSLRPALPL